MKPKILSWNIRGLNNRGKHFHVKNLFLQRKFDRICLQGPKYSWLTRQSSKVYGDAFMGVGFSLHRVGPPVISLRCGTRGLWNSLSSALRNLWWLVFSRMWMMGLNGLSWVSCGCFVGA